MATYHVLVGVPIRLDPLQLPRVTNPNNPTGAVLTEAEMDAVVGVARRHRAWLVADEIYRGSELSVSPHPPSGAATTG